VKTMEQRIAEAKQRVRNLTGRHQKAEVQRKRAEAQQAKKNDARRKLLAGTVVLDRVRSGELAEAHFLKWLDEALDEPQDRALFNLAPAGKNSKPPTTPSSPKA